MHWKTCSLLLVVIKTILFTNNNRGLHLPGAANDNPVSSLFYVIYTELIIAYSVAIP